MHGSQHMRDAISAVAEFMVDVAGLEASICVRPIAYLSGVHYPLPFPP
jgi:hypothetical protein